MDSNLVTLEVFFLKKGRVRDDTRADDEKGGLEVNLVQIVKEIRRVRSRAIVICETPGVLLRAGGDIGFARATTARPPTDAWVGCRLRVRRASTSNSRRIIGDLDTRCLNFLNPLQHLRGIRRWWRVKGRVVARQQSGNVRKARCIGKIAWG
jgi:hypothetical protein